MTLGAEFLDVLLLGEAADQEAVFGFGNYVSVKAFHYHGLFGSGVDDAVLAVEEAHVGAYGGVAVFIGLQMRLDGTPASEVAPGEIFGDDIDARGLLHDGVVDGNLFAGREEALQLSALLVSKEGGGQLVHDARNLRGVGAQFPYNSIYVPHKDACIPEIVAVFQILEGGVQVRFLLELAYLHQLAMQGLGGVDVAVTRFRAGGRNTYGDNGVPFLGERQGLGYGLCKLDGLEHQGVSRGDHYVGLRVLLLNLPGGVGDAGGRVAAFRFGQDLVLRDGGQLLLHQVHVLFSGDHPEVVLGADRGKAVHGELEEAAAHAQHVYELFGYVRGGKRPEPAPDTASHNDNVCIHAVQC